MEVSDSTPWNAKEDALLAACVAQEEDCDWKIISEKMGTHRTWLSCLHRWTKHLMSMPNHGLKCIQAMRSQDLRHVFHSAPAQNDNHLLGKKRARDPDSLVYSEIYPGNLQSAKKISRFMPTELTPTGVLAMGTLTPTSAAMGAPRPTSAAMGAPRPASAAMGAPRPASSAMGAPRPASSAMGAPRPPSTATGAPRPASSAMGAPRPASAATGAPRPASSAMGAPRPTSSAMGAPRPASAATGAPRPSSAATGAPRPASSAMGAPRPTSSAMVAPDPLQQLREPLHQQWELQTRFSSRSLKPTLSAAMGALRPASSAMGAPRPTSSAMGAPRPTSSAMGAPDPLQQQVSETHLNRNGSSENHFISNGNSQTHSSGGSLRATLSAAMGTPRSTSAAMGAPRPKELRSIHFSSNGSSSENALNSYSKELHSFQSTPAFPEQISQPSVQDGRNMDSVPTGRLSFFYSHNYLPCCIKSRSWIN